MNILLGVSSSIAAHRALDLASSLRKRGHAVRAVLTDGVQNLVGPAAFEAITGERCITSLWGSGHEGEMDHLATTKWADVFAFVPASANTLAALAHGIAADALGTFALAFNKRPFIIAPAMNPEMWHNAAVQANVAMLRARGHRFVGPVSGSTACGDVGVGRLATVDEVEQAIIEQIENWEPLPRLNGVRVLISGGPTREFSDDVRFVSNPSSGRMALAIARDAVAAGAHVTLVCGPVELLPPDGLARVVRVVSADEMRDGMLAALPQSDIIVFAAAVSDWRPAERRKGKMKKRDASGGESLALARTPDIAMEASKQRRADQLFVGFAAESDKLLANAQKKLSAKGFDLVFANPINESGVGFEADQNRGVLLWRDGRREEIGTLSKRRLARNILIEVARLRAGDVVATHAPPRNKSKSSGR